MYTRHIRSVLTKRVALWLLGQALPHASDLEPHARAALRSLIAGLLAGLMVAIGATAALVALYFYLSAEGLSTNASLGCVSLISFLLAYIAYLGARGSTREVAEVSDSLELFNPEHAGKLVKSVSAVVSGFLEGMAEESEAREKTEVREVKVVMEELVEVIKAHSTDPDHFGTKQRH